MPLQGQHDALPQLRAFTELSTVASAVMTGLQAHLLAVLLVHIIVLSDCSGSLFV